MPSDSVFWALYTNILTHSFTHSLLYHMTEYATFNMLIRQLNLPVEPDREFNEKETKKRDDGC